MMIPICRRIASLFLRFLIVLCFVLIAQLYAKTPVHASQTVGTINSNYLYGWGENLGWINFGPTNGGSYYGLTITDTAVTGYAWSKTYGWINFSPSTSGVTNSCTGTLGGYAWSSQLGWIPMSGVTINSTGRFTGVGGSASNSAGRITFDCANCNVQTDWRPCANRGGGGGPPPNPGGGGTNPGNGGTDTGNGGTDTGNGGTDTGNGGTDTGNGGTDTGNGGTDTGNGGTDTGNGGTDTGNGGTDTGNGGTDTGNGGTDTGNGGTDTGNGGTDTGNGGTDTGNGGTDTGSGGTGTGGSGTDAGSGTGGSGSSGGSSSGSSSSGGGGGFFINRIVNATSTPEIIKNVVNTIQKTTSSTKKIVSDVSKEVTNTVKEQVTNAVSLLPEPVQQATKETAQKVEEIVNDPEVEQTNEQVIAPTLTAAGAANVAVGFQFPQLLIFLRYLFTQPLLLLRRRRQKEWGSVYNVYSKQPIDLATIRVLDSKTDAIITSQVTDSKGRYFILLKPGLYRVEVQKTGFTQTSEFLKNYAKDPVYGTVYHTYDGVSITEKKTVLNVNIPLEPIEKDTSTKIILKKHRKASLQYIGSTVGLVISILSYIVSPTPIIAVLILLHVMFLYAFYVLSRRGKRSASVGIVRDAFKRHRLGRVAVRVFDATYNKLVDTTVTDRKGRYGLLVGPSTYYVTYEKSGYEKKKSPSLDFSNKKTRKESGGVIARDEKLKPVSASKKDSEITHSADHPTTVQPPKDPTRQVSTAGTFSSETVEDMQHIAEYGKDDPDAPSS